MMCKSCFPKLLAIGLLCSGLLAGGFGSAAASTDAVGSAFLNKYCVRCHGKQKQEADLRLDLLNELGGDQRRERWQQIRQRVTDKAMPPPEAQQPDQRTRAEFLESIRTNFGEAAPEHWAFRPVVRPRVPVVEGVRGIDAFVLTELQRHRLGFAPPAERHQLIRRVTLDLIGLPPTPEEVRAFVEDARDLDQAYARVVDRLLESPRYGERWAQHWLDVIRWAETVGFETNRERPNAWHYRDWVIDSLNEDKPYDRFIREQIVGDTIGEDAALGFLVAGPANLPGQIGRDEQAMRQARQDELDEVIRTVSQSLWALTVGCARCHDHKFDPITQHDYYAMQAIFAGLSYGDRRLRGMQNDQWAARLPEARAKLARLEQQLRDLQQRFRLRPPLENVQTESFPAARVQAIRMEIAATGKGAASLYEFEVWSVAEDGRPSRNVALAADGATVSASSFALANQTRHFDNLIDGSVDQRQAFPWVAADAGPAWLQIDLPRAETVDRVVWHAGSSLPASYEIQVRESDSAAWRSVADTGDRLPHAGDTRRAGDVRLDGMSSSQIDKLFQLLQQVRDAQSLVKRLAQGPQTYAASFQDRPQKTWLLVRGDPLQRGKQVAPAVPAMLKTTAGLSPEHPAADAAASRLIEAGTANGPQGDQREPVITGSRDLGGTIGHAALNRPADEPGHRLALVQHVVRPDHPLTSRVLVNRLWQHHFGRGLVETPSDFGRMGGRPSHPVLLDWLAAELVDRGWSWKQMHRLIVSSRTYRQSSLPVAVALAIDAESRLLWRYPPRRLDAEAIRDSILAVSGKLNLQMHGPGFDFFDRRGGLSDYTPKETFDARGWRRMIYAHKIRMESVDIFGAFDCPDAGQMTPRRNLSITPIQALGLFNSPFANRQAAFFAERIRRETKDDPQEQVERAFVVALSRPPTTGELSRMVELARAHGLGQVCRVLLNSSEFLFLN